ncbi:MAG: UDP-N-acetylglucosamine 1-carboxyvinyltransferase [Alphaproteobacteria bacterium]|nr:UDP-N-acetylglucosamine 1-carboxyvinyltransferase [Alphaproteobacteria bacterium]
MERIRVRGGRRLNGTIQISGAKNAALPLMAASLLTPEALVLSNVPKLADIATLAALLGQHGAAIDLSQGDGAGGQTMTLRAATITSTTAPYDLVRKMRASVLVLGPLLARCHQARVSLPGGCAIGTRPVDLHLKALEQLGARIELEEGYVNASAPGGLKGGRVRFPTVSVGATENVMMAATLAAGETVLENVAREPEIGDLAACLTAMGARISGAGSERIVIQGVAELGGAHHQVMADRIETGTYMAAAAITGGALTLTHTDADTLGAVVDALAACGVGVARQNGTLTVSPRSDAISPTDISTQPYPGFPTDMQAQFMALLTTADGASTINETIFENRFMHVPELIRMGANISLQGHTAVVRGVKELHGAPVMATDLRASVSLVLAGLAAEGETTVSRVYHLDRGYEHLVEKLAACGADIERIAD